MSDAPSGKAILTEDPMAIGAIDRTDLADLVLQVLGSTSGRCTRRELTAIDLSRYRKSYEPYSV